MSLLPPKLIDVLGFGYPALAMVMLLLAGATYLADQIVRHDRAPNTR